MRRGFPLLKTPTKKNRRRRCLASLGMTNTGGGLCPPPTPPTDDFKTLGGKLERGFPPFQKCHSEPPLRGVSSLFRGGVLTLLELHPKNFKSLLGKVRRGSFNPFDLTAEIPRAKALGMYRVVSIPFTENFKVFMKFILAL